MLHMSISVKELIQYIAQAMVDNPGEVSVSEIEGNQTMVLELKVAKTDLGKVIGKQGRNAQAIRTILGAVCAKIKKRVVLEIVE
jgi:predicted RNA-binding protein YlqC (UPF0109 family)